MAGYKAKKYTTQSKEHDLVALAPSKEGLIVQNRSEQEVLGYSDLELKPVGFMDCLTIIHDRKSQNIFISTDDRLLGAIKKFADGQLYDQVCAQRSRKKKEFFVGMAGWSVISIIRLTYSCLRALVMKLFQLVLRI